MKISMKRCLLGRLSAVILPLGMLFSPASADEFHHWVSQQDGVFENDDAWVPARVPSGPDEIGLFGQQTDLTIGLQTDHTLAELQFANKTNVTFKTAVPFDAEQRGNNRFFAVENVNVNDAFFRLHSVGADSADENSFVGQQGTQQHVVQGMAGFVPGEGTQQAAAQQIQIPDGVEDLVFDELIFVT